MIYFMEEQTKSAKRREHIKNILIIFLVILLLLTFFSNTILNHSLPTVSAQYASHGTITEKVRGSGTVAANQSYQITAESKRTVSSVSVKIGDEIKAGDKLFVLDPQNNNEEIKTAEAALQEAELAYQKALLTAVPDYAAENQEITNARADLQTAINKLNTAKTQTQAISDAAYQQAQADYKNATAQASVLSDYLSSVLSGELDSIPAQYTADLAEAQSAVQAATKNLEAAQANLEAMSAGTSVSSTEQEQTIRSLEREAEKAQTAYERAKADYEEAQKNGIPEDYQLPETAPVSETDSDSDSDSDSESDNNTPSFSLTDMKRAMEDAEQTFRYAREDVEAAKNMLSLIQTQEQALADAQAAVRQATAEQETAQAVYKSASSGISARIQADISAVNAQADSAQSVITAYENQKSNDITDVSVLEEDVSQKERALQTLLINLAEKKQEDSLSQQVGQLELQSQRNAIDKQKAELDKLKQDNDTQIITSKNDGIVSEVNCAAGDNVTEGDVLANITLTNSGYTVQLSATAEQAKKLHVGMTAEITNQYYSDITAKLTAIRPNTEKAGSSDKLLIFDVSGNDVNPGQSLTLSISTSSENYDCVVPTSAIMEDNDGKFVLVVKAKSTPLGNRYYASRCDVTVLAHDDINSAVQGDVVGSDFVITTSEKPLVAGTQVRMEDDQ